MHIRMSDMQSFMDCPRQWYLTRYRGLTSPEKPGLYAPTSRDIGSTVDLAMRGYYWDGKDPSSTIRALAEERSFSEEETHPGWADVYATSARMMEGYLEWLADTGSDHGEVTVGVELELEAEIIPGVFIHGHLDRLVFDTNFDDFIVDDTKTVDQIPKSELFDINFQLLTYIWLLRKIGIEASRGRHTYLRRVKRTGRANPPFYARSDIFVNDVQMANHEEHLKVLVHRIVDATYCLNCSPGTPEESGLYPHVTRDCEWKCPVKSVCVSMSSDTREVSERVVSGMLVPYERSTPGA